jgi:hypothetical protein
VEKFDLIALVLDEHSLLLENSRNEFTKLKEQYALANATLVVVFLGERANRIIAGQQINDIEVLPCFDDTEGRQDVTIAVQGWIYEAQANMYSGSTVKLRTAIFVDVSDDVIKEHGIKPTEILGNLQDTDYFSVNRDGEANNYELVIVSRIARLEALAKTGDEKALYELGIAYLNGDGVAKSEPQAQMLLYKSYLHGNIEGIFALVDLFDEPTEHFRKLAAKHRK